MKLRRVVLALAVLVVLLPVLGVAAAVLLFDGEALKPRAIEAVRRATGRDLTIAGPVRLGWSLTPTVSAEGVALANPPGMSRPAMATLARLDVQVALWPLLRRRVEVRGLTLVSPDVLLERDGAGQPNWVFTRPAAPVTVPAPTVSGPPEARTQFSVDAVQVRDGCLGWLSAGRLDRVAITDLQLRTEAPGTVRVQGDLAVNEVPLVLQGTTGTLAASGDAWPVDVRLSGGGAALRAVGKVGTSVALTAEVPNLDALSQLAGRSLPSLRDVQASAQLGPAGLSALSAQASGDIGSLHLARATLTAPALNQPLNVAAEGQAAGSPVTLTGTAGSLAALLGLGGTLLKAQMKAAGATLAMEGVLDMRAASLLAQVSADVPDVRALGSAAGLRLPAWRAALLLARLTAAPGRVAMSDMLLTLDGANLAGNLAFTTGPRLAVEGSLASKQVNLDTLFPRVAAPASDAPSPPAAAPNPPAPSSAAPRSLTGPARLLPDDPLPYAALRAADANVTWTGEELVWRGVPFRAVSARLLLQDGRLRLDPLTAEVPGGVASATLAADAGAQTASLSFQAQGLSAGPLLAALTGAAGGGGTLDLDVALQGQGASPRALAATLDGHAGVALVDGDFDLGGIMATLGDALPKGLPVSSSGRSQVRCLAVRAEVTAGQVALRTLLLDSSRLHLTGEGGVNLADDTLDLHLRPQVRLAIGGVSVPVRVTGPLRAPRTQAEIAGGAGHPGLLIGAPPPPDECAARLTEARGGRSGPLPAAAPDVPRPKPADILRNLLR